jgi:hypothetical protein
VGVIVQGVDHMALKKLEELMQTKIAKYMNQGCSKESIRRCRAWSVPAGPLMINFQQEDF